MPVAKVDNRSGAEALLLLAMTMVLVLLLMEWSGLVAIEVASLALLAALPALAMLLCAIARRWNLHCLHSSVFAIVLGGIGVLAGSRLDFGQFGLVSLAEWCRAMQAVSLDTMWAQVASAPWTYGGMLGGCNLGLALSTRFFDRAVPTRPEFTLRLIACNAGMILGMLLPEILLSRTSLVGGDARTAARLLQDMVLGMTAGMWIGWWFAGCVLVAWRRLAFPGASPTEPRLATGST